MRNFLGPVIIIVLLGVVIGVPLAMRPATPETTSELTLVVVTPHNEQIRHEASTAFNRWRAERGLPPVEFDFRSGGGTSDLRKQIIAEYEAEARRALEHVKARHTGCASTGPPEPTLAFPSRQPCSSHVFQDDRPESQKVDFA